MPRHDRNSAFLNSAVLNSAFLNRAALPVVKRSLSLYADSLVVAAMKSGGEPELGMEAISEPFEVLTGALRDEAQLHAAGIVRARRQVVDLLSMRGRALALIERHPEIDALAVPAPIVITGLLHTGTDTLASALADGPRARPADEDRLMGVHMASMRFELDWHVPAYAEWYDEADLQAGYGWLRRLLQVQQWADPQEDPRRWVLRSMQHLEQLPTLLTTFPDAVIVQAHRDLDPVIEATATTVADLRRRCSSQVDPTQIARYWRWRAERMLERNATQRATLDAARVIDVSADDIAADAAAVATEVLTRAG